MVIKWLSKYKYETALALVIIGFVLYKLPFLNVPYYWDEAWPYSTATHILYNHGLSLMPNAIPPFISRGHPLMFFFLAAAWMKIFGSGFIAVHSFALTVSVATLIATFAFCRRFFNPATGFIATLLLCVQPVFISQSAFLMPEMLMAFWTIVCLHAWFSGKKIFFVLAAAAMLLTKESGVVLFITLSLVSVVAYSRHKTRKILFNDFLLLVYPAAIAFLYFLLQRMIHGWFLFPFYTGYITSHWQAIAGNLQSALEYVFIYYGRNGISGLLLLCGIIIPYRKKWTFLPLQVKVLATLSAYVILYLMFSCINYYIPRYLLCLFPAFTIIFAVLIDKAFEGWRYIVTAAVVGTSATCLYFYIHQGYGGDNNYLPSLYVANKMVDYCEQHQLTGKHIFAPSVMRINLSEKYAGFLSGQPFSNLQPYPDKQTDYYIFTRDEFDEQLFKNMEEQQNLRLVKRFDSGYAWSALYEAGNP